MPAVWHASTPQGRSFTDRRMAASDLPLAVSWRGPLLLVAHAWGTIGGQQFAAGGRCGPNPLTLA